VPQPLLAVDAPSLLFRAFYALPDTITDKDGRPVNALLGALNMIFRVVADYEPRAVVLCFGPDAADYRTELYPPYHAQRPPVPPDLDRQFQEAKDFFEAFGWTVTWSEDHEADDLLGSYARLEEEQGGTALVLTGDRDMYQCATDRTTVLYVKTGTRGVEEVDPGEVRKRYGIAPEQVPDFIALRGDSSDRIPGARGVGPKTAADLLRKYGSLEAALAAGRFSTIADDLRLYRRIATMDAGAPVPELTEGEPRWARAAEKARELGLNALAKRLDERV
jgi:5'-3' exonuclease